MHQTPSSASSDLPPWVRESARGVELDVLVQPRASRTKVVGVHDDRLKLQLAAPPVDGAANEALIEFVSSALGVAQRLVSLIRGETNRRKTLLIESVPLDAVLKAFVRSTP